jgi:cystathionine beta-lyase
MTQSTPQSRKNMRARTKLVHAGREPSEQFGYVNTPIYRGSTVLQPTLAALEARHSARFTYGTHGTPTTEALELAWSEIAGAAHTVLTPSGLAAITLALLTALKAGDHLLVSDSAYLPTRTFCNGFLRRMNIETTYYDPLIGAGIEALMRPNTKAVLVEAPGSQSFEMQDIPAIAEVAHAHGACVVMDNTWATPLFFPPHERGVDLAVEAGTKYLSGHSDLLLGLVSANQQWARPLRQTFDFFAMCAGPEDVFLALRGLRSMELRLREAERQGLALARWLRGRAEVSRVLHPALEEDPGHEIWKRDFSGSSGLFSVILKPAPKAALAALLDNLQLFGLGYSWGGYESLVIPFDCAKYRTATQWKPEGPALRFSVGLEDIEDLKEDLDRGFALFRAQL